MSRSAEARALQRRRTAYAQSMMMGMQPADVPAHPWAGAVPSLAMAQPPMPTAEEEEESYMQERKQKKGEVPMCVHAASAAAAFSPSGAPCA